MGETIRIERTTDSAICVLTMLAATALCGCSSTYLIEQTNDAGDVVHSYEAKSEGYESLEHGEARWWFGEGTLAAKGRFKNGERAGRWSFYYIDGELRSTGWYRRGRREGRWRYFSPDGKYRGELLYFSGSDSRVERYISRTPAPEEAYGAAGDRLMQQWITLEVATWKNRFAKCHSTHVEDKSSGELIILLAIAPEGAVVRAMPNHSQFDESAFHDCVTETFEAMQFVRPAGDEVLVVSFPLTFPDLEFEMNHQESPERLKTEPYRPGMFERPSI